VKVGLDKDGVPIVQIVLQCKDTILPVWTLFQGQGTLPVPGLGITIPGSFSDWGGFGLFFNYRLRFDEEAKKLHFELGTHFMIKVRVCVRLCV